jgi:hypothetical protein
MTELLPDISEKEQAELCQQEWEEDLAEALRLQKEERAEQRRHIHHAQRHDNEPFTHALTRKQFEYSMFELTDTWTDGDLPSDYMDFIIKTLMAR